MKPYIPVLTLAAITGLVLTGCGSEEQAEPAGADTIEGELFAVEDPWIKATEEAMETDSDDSMTDAFAHRTRVSGEDQTNIDADAEIAVLLELHEVVDEEGIKGMKEKEGSCPVAAEEPCELNPGED